MSVTEHLMRIGSWNATLRPDTPKAIRQQIRKLDHFVVTTAPVDVTGMSDANVLALSIYTGVILDRDQFGIAGASPLWWLGSEDGVGPSGYQGAVTDLTFTITGADPAAFFAKMFAAANSITETINTSGLAATVDMRAVAVGSARELLDYACTLFGAEYKMTPAFVVNIATAANLFVTTPTAVLTRLGNSQHGTRRGISAPNLSMRETVRNITTDVVIVDVTGATTTVATAASPPKDPFNNTAAFIRRVPADSSATATNPANAILALFQTAQQVITLDSDTYQVTRFMVPGDTVYVYEPDEDIYDTANQVEFNGAVIFPKSVRIKSVTWDLESGMGFYVRQTAATPVYVDITEWVVVEAAGRGALVPEDDQINFDVLGYFSGPKRGGYGELPTPASQSPYGEYLTPASQSGGPGPA